MLMLSLIRHAKSSWDDPDLEDRERPLSRRGQKAAPLVGRYIAASLPPVSRVLCSDAVRTRATLTLVLAELAPPPPPIDYERSLYLAAPPIYLNQLSGCASTDTHVLVLGHNPGIHMLALELAGGGDYKALERLTGKFPTGALAVIEFDVRHWRDVTRASGRLTRFVTPKQLA